MLGELGKYYQHMKLDCMRHSSKITEIDSALLEMTKGNGCRRRRCLLGLLDNIRDGISAKTEKASLSTQMHGWTVGSPSLCGRLLK